MVPTPTGRIYRSDDALYDLTLTRTFRAGPHEVWDAITNPARTAQWIGPWRGESGEGKVIELQLSFEDGAPWSSVRIEDCEPPHLLAVSVLDEAGHWELQIRLTHRIDETELMFVHHVEDPALAESVGPGWEYYLDNLVAARDGLPRPSFDDYYPAQAEYFTAEAARALTHTLR